MSQDSTVDSDEKDKVQNAETMELDFDEDHSFYNDHEFNIMMSMAHFLQFAVKRAYNYYCDLLSKVR
jgi:hypothetical protein